MAKRKNSKSKEKKFELIDRINNIDSGTRNKIIATILAFIAIVILLALFNKAGALGSSLKMWSYWLLGNSLYVLPIFLAYISYTLFVEDFEKRWQVILSSFLILWGVSGMFACYQYPDLKPINGNLGGWLGYGSYGFVAGYLGGIVSFVLHLALMVIGIWVILPFLGVEREKLSFEIKDEKKSKKGEGDSVIKKVFAPKFNVEKLGGDNPKVTSGNTQSKPEKPEKNAEPLLEMKKIKLPVEKDYKFPPVDLLEEDKGGADSGDIKANSLIIKRTLQNFGIAVEVSEVNVGPSVTQYAIKPAEGVDIKKISNLSSNLSLALSAHPIRIETPIPGRPLVGIEIPNKQKSMVRLRNMIEDPQFVSPPSQLYMALGRDVSGSPVFADLGKMPHLLVAGSTGTGKTVCLNELIVSLLYLNSPNSLRMILVDPKRVELSAYADLPHLLTDVVHNAQKTLNALKWLTEEMDRRFDVLQDAKCRDIGQYNKEQIKKGEEIMPHIVFIVDELADLMATKGKELEAGIVRIAQMARAAGIHMILATQRPSVEVVTGLIKANVPARICFRVASQIDSRTILDMAGGEKLLGFGDMLFLSSQSPKPKRLQGAFLSEKEVKAAVDYIVENSKVAREDDNLSKSMEEAISKSEGSASGSGEGGGSGGEGDDPMYEEAKKVVLETRKASTSFLQRRLRLGYARAARLIDLLEQNGVIGPGDGAKPREVLMNMSDDIQLPEEEDALDDIEI